MFEQSILPSGTTRKRWTVSVAVLVQLVIVGVIMAIPLLYVQSLPMAELTSILMMPPPPPPPPPPPAAAKVARVMPRQFKMNVLVAPRTIPTEPVIPASATPDLPAAAVDGVPGGVPGGVPNGMLGGILGSIPEVAPPPPPPPAAPAPAPVATPARIQVGGQVQAAKLIHQVMPQYPQIAHDARLGGMVRLKAVIAKNGTVEDLSVISGLPILVPSAMNAVKQWVYKPTFLNGVPIEVGTEIDVTFAMST